MLVSGNHLYVCGNGGELVEYAEVARLSCTQSLTAKAKGILRTLWLGQGERLGIQTAVGLALSDVEPQLLQFIIYMMRVKTVHLVESSTLRFKLGQYSVVLDMQAAYNVTG